MEHLTNWLDENMVWLAPLGVVISGLVITFIKGAISKGLSGIGDKVTGVSAKADVKADELKRATLSQAIKIRIDDLHIKKIALRDDAESVAEIERQITSLTNDLNNL